MYAISPKIQPMLQISILESYFLHSKIISGGLYHLATMWEETSPSFCSEIFYSSNSVPTGNSFSVTWILPCLVRNWMSVFSMICFWVWPFDLNKVDILEFSYCISVARFGFTPELLDRPKSQNLIEQSAFSKILAGLISLCIIPAECMKWIPHNMLYKIVLKCSFYSEPSTPASSTYFKSFE